VADTARTIIDKIWDAHAITTREDGQSLLWVDRHLVHEGSFHAFDQIAARGAAVARPDLTFGVADHYVPTRNRGRPVPDASIARMVDQLVANCRRSRNHPVRPRRPPAGHRPRHRHGAGPDLPGLTVVCGDSHTSTHGAFGAYAFGIGASEVAHVLMTQTLWQKKPKRMRISVDGTLPRASSAKDIALTVIARIGADGAAGTCDRIRGLGHPRPVDGGPAHALQPVHRGRRALGMVAPDETTFAYLRGRPYAPKGDAFERAVEDWRALASDRDASFDREVVLDAASIAPTVTWGTSPEQALPIDATVPDPDRIADPGRAQAVRDALAYMGLTPGMALGDIRIDRVFIGSCTNSRIEDLRAAAAVLAGRRAAVPGLVSPGSSQVKRQAEEEGLDRIFRDAGLEWVESGCSMCVGMNGDIVPPGERCASTTNRNFKGRQGPGARTHLMSPAMVAAAAIAGRLTDMRPLLAGRTP
jgi:3-isopropylmalate/(R)-2-methylmalate dehydratase large subunit